MEKYPLNRSAYRGCGGNYATLRTPECEQKVSDRKETLPIAMAYVPMQEFKEVFDLPYAFHAGTIFPQLWKPFCGKGRCGR